MDVLCVGMNRAGSTWQYDVVCHLVERHRQGRRLGFVKSGADYAELERREPAGAAWRVLKSHDGHTHFAAALAAGRARAVYCYRDLRDVAFSLAHKCSCTFEYVVEDRRFLHTCLANDRFWTAQPRTLVQRYEDVMADPAAGVTALAAHLGIDLAAGEAAAVAEDYSLTANLWRTIELTNRLRERGVEPDEAGEGQGQDRETLLHWNHIRTGRVGGWRDQATPRQVAVLAGVCGSWLVERGYEPDDSWALPVFGHLRHELEATQQQLHDRDRELDERNRRLNALEQLGPVALGLARRVHQWSMRYPRLSATVKRLLSR
jgi:hypothetical protein